MHAFEFAHEENTEFALSGRVPFAEIEKIRSAILANATVSALLEALPIPAIVTNQQRQLVHLNRPALEMVQAASQSEVLGLRLGEYFGIEHAFHGKECRDQGGCADCNAMQALVSALGGDCASESGILVMFPHDPARTRKYRISTAPLPVDGRRLAVLFAMPTGSTGSVNNS